jgi:predicted nucleic acid-binding protein
LGAIGDSLAALRAGGVTVPLADAIIATAAISNNISLWTRDNHFQQIKAIIPVLSLHSE